MAIDHKAATVGGFNAPVENFRAWRLCRNDRVYTGPRATEGCHAPGICRGSDGGEHALDWYSSEAFELGNAYADADAKFCLEFAGVTIAKAARQLPGVRDQMIEARDEFEQVLVFIVRGSREPISFYCHTRADADVGYWFTSYVEVVQLATVTLAAGMRSA